MVCDDMVRASNYPSGGNLLQCFNFFIKAANFLFKFLHWTSDTYTKSDMIHFTFETSSNIDAGGIISVGCHPLQNEAFSKPQSAFVVVVLEAALQLVLSHDDTNCGK